MCIYLFLNFSPNGFLNLFLSRIQDEFAELLGRIFVIVVLHQGAEQARLVDRRLDLGFGIHQFAVVDVKHVNLVALHHVHQRIRERLLIISQRLHVLLQLAHVVVHFNP